MVGLSSCEAEAKVEAPMLSPAETNKVFGFCARSSSTAPARTAAPAESLLGAMRPWKSLMSKMSRVKVSAAGSATVAAWATAQPAATKDAVAREVSEMFLIRLSAGIDSPQS